MEHILITETKSTPRILIDYESALIEFKGRSILENSVCFYEPILKWIEYYIKNISIETILNIELDYLNSSASKILVLILKMLKNLPNKLIVNWIYDKDDEDIFNKGKDFSYILDIEFNFKINNI